MGQQSPGGMISLEPSGQSGLGHLTKEQSTGGLQVEQLQRSRMVSTLLSQVTGGHSLGHSLIGTHLGQHSPGRILPSYPGAHLIGGHLTARHLSTQTGQQVLLIMTGR